jgi:hypothetical protein
MRPPDILPCKICGITPTYAGSHGNTFGPEENWHVHHRCKVVCECHLKEDDKGHRFLPDISRWNEVNKV